MKAMPPHLRPVLEAPLRTARSVNALGRAVWLYLAFVLHANERGTAIRARQRWAEDLGVAEADIDRWLHRLINTRLVDLQSPSPFLVISLRSWPRSGLVAEDFRSPAAAASTSAAEDADATAEKEKNKHSNVGSRDGGPGEGISVLAELAAVLGEADASEFGPVIAEFPEDIVRRALDRVRATPSRQIKKSRAAYLRYLLKNSSDSTHA